MMVRTQISRSQELYQKLAETVGCCLLVKAGTELACNMGLDCCLGDRQSRTGARKLFAAENVGW